MTLILMWHFQFSKQLSLSLSHHLSYLNHTNNSQKKQEREQKEIRKLIKNTSRLNVHVCKITIIFNITFYKYLI